MANIPSNPNAEHMRLSGENQEIYLNAQPAQRYTPLSIVLPEEEHRHVAMAFDWRFHFIHGFRKDKVLTAQKLARTQYVFDFCSMRYGASQFMSKISANIKAHKYCIGYVGRRIAMEREQLAAIERLPIGEVTSINGPEQMGKGYNHVKNLLARDTMYWELFHLELAISNLAYDRVKIAADALHLSEAVLHGYVPNELDLKHHQEIFDRFQQIGWQMRAPIQQIILRSGGLACLNRHRNELWDIVDGFNNGGNNDFMW